MQPVTEEKLQEIAKKLVAAVHPDKIILFGSRARGDHRLDSDVDLLIIKDSSEPGHRRVIPAYRALSDSGIAKDILWYTRQEIEDWHDVKNHVTTVALREGRVLYEKN